ncbi:hypothetical protein ACH4NV_20425 [Streptomyces althioticus]|uniref:hypothetical protein n=1 Tax=Streptomyces althioticus TaxID=83380 RepID=UPI0037AD3F9A
MQVSGTQNITYVQNGPPPPSRRDGFAALANDQYATAFTVFGALITQQPGDAELRLGLALTMLQGRHPCRCDVRTLKLVDTHLRAARTMGPRHPGPSLALLLLRDAEMFRWDAHRRRPTQKDLRLLQRVRSDTAALLVKHIPARESVLWQELAQVAEAGTPGPRPATAPARRSPKPSRKRNRP